MVNKNAAEYQLEAMPSTGVVYTEPGTSFALIRELEKAKAETLGRLPVLDAANDQYGNAIEQLRAYRASGEAGAVVAVTDYLHRHTEDKLTSDVLEQVETGRYDNATELLVTQLRALITQIEAGTNGAGQPVARPRKRRMSDLSHMLTDMTLHA